MNRPYSPTPDEQLIIAWLRTHSSDALRATANSIERGEHREEMRNHE